MEFEFFLEHQIEDSCEGFPTLIHQTGAKCCMLVKRSLTLCRKQLPYRSEGNPCKTVKVSSHLATIQGWEQVVDNM